MFEKIFLIFSSVLACIFVYQGLLLVKSNISKYREYHPDTLKKKEQATHPERGVLASKSHD